MTLKAQNPWSSRTNDLTVKKPEQIKCKQRVMHPADTGVVLKILTKFYKKINNNNTTTTKNKYK